MLLVYGEAISSVFNTADSGSYTLGDLAYPGMSFLLSWIRMSNEVARHETLTWWRFQTFLTISYRFHPFPLLSMLVSQGLIALSPTKQSRHSLLENGIKWARIGSTKKSRKVPARERNALEGWRVTPRWMFADVTLMFPTSCLIVLPQEACGTSE